MFSKVSVLVPTRKRLARLATLLESFEKTTDGAAELVFKVDDDDWETQQFLKDRRMIVSPRLDGYRSMPAFYNQLWQAASGDVLMCGNDDMVFRTVGWPSLVLEAANRYPDGLFNFGVRTHNETHYPFSIISRKTAETLGFFWDPRIYWGDVYLRDVLGAFGRSLPLPDVQIDHDWVGFQPDATFVEADQNSIMQRDPNYWAATHAPAVEEAVHRLRIVA